MLFNRKVFVVFLAVVLAVYYRLGAQGKLWFLLGMSFVFYGFWDARLCLLVGVSVLVSYASGLWTVSVAGSTRRWAFGLGLLVNLGALFFFKYTNFFLDSCAALVSVLGGTWKSSHLPLLLPVGISFYTFQLVSYNIDVYRREIPAERNLRDFALYLMFFPQLVAGPVERASHLLPQYKLDFRLTRDQVLHGIFLILLGFLKKIVLADRLADWIAPQFAEEATSGTVAWLSVLLFTTDIYLDFSAYSDIAIGVGKLLGYDIRANFDLPFVVPSIPERWRRWHISMSHWFRDYVYYPLGGNRRGAVRTQVNILAVMFLSGLWHGASYNFVVWGLLNGLSMVAHRWLTPLLGPIAAWMGRWWLTRWGYFYLCCLNTMLLISSINIFFRSDNWEVAASFVRTMFMGGPLGVWRDALALDHLPGGYRAGLWMFGIVLIAHEAQRHVDLQARIFRSRWLWGVSCASLFAVIVLFGVRGGGRFIYFQF